MNKTLPGQNETFHIIIPLAINKSLCRQMPKVYDISGRYHSLAALVSTNNAILLFLNILGKLMQFLLRLDIFIAVQCF